MKFGKQLARHLVQRWSEHYIDYNGLKLSLRENLPADGEAGASFQSPPGISCQGALPPAWKAWMGDVQKSIDHVNHFFESVAHELEERTKAAQDELQEPRSTGGELHLSHAKNTVQTLQATLTDLSNFASANYTALYKIFKKFDKLTGLAVSARALQHIANQPFHGEGKARLQRLQDSLDSLAQSFDIDSQARLEGPMTSRNLWHVARFSFSLGVIFMALLVLAVLSGIEPQSEEYSPDVLSAVVPVFRICFMVNLSIWLAGACACVFEQYGVNYLFLLDIAPEHEISGMALLNFASAQTGLWILVFFAFLADVKFNAIGLSRNAEHDVQWLAHTYIMSLLVAQLFLYLMVPTTRHVLAVLCGICFFHFSAVSFAENMSADLLASFGKPLKDVWYTSCYMLRWSTAPLLEINATCKHPGGASAWLRQVVQVFPLMVRISQCLRRIHFTGRVMPHALNCGKYVTAVVMTVLAGTEFENLRLFNPSQLFAIRITAYLIATVSACAWDLVMDFGLLQEGRRRLYPERAYKVIALLNIPLRSTWALTYLPDCHAFVSQSAFNSECFVFVISALELFRRALWAAVRMEHEHLSNASRFRSVCWVPPLTKPARKAAPDSGLVDAFFSPKKSQPSGLQRLLRKVKIVALLTPQAKERAEDDADGGATDIEDSGVARTDLFVPPSGSNEMSADMSIDDAHVAFSSSTLRRRSEPHKVDLRGLVGGLDSGRARDKEVDLRGLVGGLDSGRARDKEACHGQALNGSWPGLESWVSPRSQEDCDKVKMHLLEFNGLLPQGDALRPVSPFCMKEDVLYHDSCPMAKSSTFGGRPRTLTAGARRTFHEV